MNPYSKMAQTAISAISLLAEAYNENAPIKFNSAQIAQKRGLPKPMIAKVLTILSQAGLVNGSPGPGGGYWLNRPPAKISLLQIISLFDRVDRNDACPFGPDHCGKGPQCPLHDQLIGMRDQMNDFLRNNTLATFLPNQRRNRPPRKLK